MKEKQNTEPQTGTNRRQRRTLAKNKKFQAEIARIVRLEFKDTVDPEVLYKKGILESIRRNTGEIHVVVTREGHEEPYFTGIPLNSIYDGLLQSARVWAEGWNAALDQRIAEETMTPEELAAHKEEKQVEATTAQEAQKAQTIERLRDLRSKITDPEESQRWVAELDADIARLENPTPAPEIATEEKPAENGTTSDERPEDAGPVS